MNEKPVESKFKVVSTRASYSKVDEPLSIYDFSDIIDTDERSDFQIDHTAYSEEIQQRFLQSPAYLLTTEEKATSRRSESKLSGLEEKYPSTSEIIAHFSSFEKWKKTGDKCKGLEQADSGWRQRAERKFKPPVLRHRSSIVVNDQLTAKKQPTQEKTSSVQSEQSHLKAIPLESLLEIIVPKPGYLPSVTLLFNVLLMIRQYMTMSDLMQHITRSFLASCNQVNRQNGRINTISIPVQVHCTLYIIFFWIRKMPYDFRCSNLMQKTRELFALCVNKFPPCFVEVRLALRSLYMKLKRLEAYEQYLESQNQLRRLDFDLTIMAVCPSPETLAKQLLIVEYDHLRHIGPEEYIQHLNAHKRVKVDMSGPKENSSNQSSYNLSDSFSTQAIVHLNKDTAYLSKKFTFNLEAYIRWLNRLSYYITTEIVRHPRRKTRAAHIEYFIDVAENSLKLNNFSSTLGVISGLDDSSVRRLRRTWQRVSNSHRTRFRYFQSLLSVSNNFATYRSAVANVITKSKNNLYVPFLCISLKDIYYINEVMPNTIDEGLVNMEKIEKIGSIVSELARLGEIARTNFARLDNVLRFLNATPVFDSTTAMQISINYESDQNE